MEHRYTQKNRIFTGSKGLEKRRKIRISEDPSFSVLSAFGVMDALNSFNSIPATFQYKITMMVLTSIIRVLPLILAAGAALSCSSLPVRQVENPFPVRDGLTTEVMDYTLYEVNRRNRNIEDSPRWIEEAYRGLKIRSLGDLGENEFEKYRDYLDRGRLYMIVHPAFFTFFEYEGEPGNRDDLTLNYLDRFLSEKTVFPKISLMQAQEKVMRDFLEIKSTQQKLIILVLPDHYRDSDRYAFRFPRDEYTRFINEVTNESDSVLYIYSRSRNSGKLRKRDMARLLSFLQSVRPESILVGGSYYGRCVSAFYRRLRRKIDFIPSYMVADLVALSPSDISFSTALSLMKSDGRLDSERLTDYLAKNKINRQRPIPDHLVNIR